jgi:hypothetical protein
MPRKTRTWKDRTQWTESFNLVERCNEHALTCSWRREEGKKNPSGCLCICVCVCIQIILGPSVEDPCFLLTEEREGRASRERFGKCSGTSEGEDPVMVCCVLPAYLLACMTLLSPFFELPDPSIVQSHILETSSVITVDTDDPRPPSDTPSRRSQRAESYMVSTA